MRLFCRRAGTERRAAVGQVYHHDLTHDAVRYHGVQLAADLAQGACQYYANPPANQLCVDTTEALCKNYCLSVWRKGYTCYQLTWGACQYYDGATPLCIATTRLDCSQHYSKSTFYPDESCGD